MEKSLIIPIILGLTLLMTSFASAEIMISQPKDTYNLEEQFNTTITLIPAVDAYDFMTSSIVCGNSSVEIFKNLYKLNASEQKTIKMALELGNFLIGDMQGTCFVRANYAGEEKDGVTFDVSSAIKVDLSVAGIIFNPGDKVKVSGNAIKNNNQPLEGFAGIRVYGLNFSTLVPVKAGKYETEFTLGDSAPAGAYEIVIDAYEKNSAGEKTNEGSATNSFRISHVVRKIEIALNSQSVKPRDEMTYTILIYDQANSNVEGEASVTISSPDGSFASKKIARANEINSFKPESNTMPGYWIIDAMHNGFEAEKQVYVEELREVSFSLANKTLIVTNTGNVPYAGPIEVTIGDKKEVDDVSLGIGETTKFRLSAPNGEYQISALGGENSQALGTALLTGRAIGISGEVSLSGLFSGVYLWIWIIIVAVLAAVVIYYYRKSRKFHSFNSAYSTPAMTMTSSSTSQMPSSAAASSAISSGGFALRRTSDVTNSASVLDEGERQECSIITLKLKNLRVLESKGSEGLAVIDRALTKAKGYGAKIYTSDAYRLIVFCPKITKEKDNSIRALSAAKDIADMLNEYNKVHAPKIEFGIGANLGEMIVEAKDGGFKFIPLGNVTNMAKRISESSDSSVLMSESVHTRTLSSAKGEKTASGFWKLNRIMNREKYSDFLNKFVDRQKKGHSLV
jgi:hypothetical protein